MHGNETLIYAAGAIPFLFCFLWCLTCCCETGSAAMGFTLYGGGHKIGIVSLSPSSGAERDTRCVIIRWKNTEHRTLDKCLVCEWNECDEKFSKWLLLTAAKIVIKETKTRAETKRCGNATVNAVVARERCKRYIYFVFYHWKHKNVRLVFPGVRLLQDD